MILAQLQIPASFSALTVSANLGMVVVSMADIATMSGLCSRTAWTNLCGLTVDIDCSFDPRFPTCSQSGDGMHSFG
jgi:hypothetical protein